MTPAKIKERRMRVRKMDTVLRRLYKDAKIALTYTTDFECLVAVELSAQCTDERVNKVTPALFKKYPTIKAFALAEQKELEQDVFQCGFYRNKAKNIIGAAKMVEQEFGGELPRTIEEMVRIPGVARKTANVVLATLYGITSGIAVDTHIRRFAIRFDLTDYTDPVRIERDLMEIVPEKDWWEFPHRLVHYGRDYCGARKHECSAHPLTPLYKEAAERWPRAH